MSSKAALKAVRTALDSKDYDTAVTKARDLVQQDPQNYHGYILFLPHDDAHAQANFFSQLVEIYSSVWHMIS